MSTGKNFVILLFLILLASSCGLVKIKDSEFCGDMGQDGATCFTTLSNQERKISPAQWEEERFGMICSNAKTFAEWKAAILKLCSMTWRCSYDDRSNIITFGKNIEKIQLKINELKGEYNELY